MVDWMRYRDGRLYAQFEGLTAAKAWATAVDVDELTWLMDCELALATEVTMPASHISTLLCLPFCRVRWSHNNRQCTVYIVQDVSCMM